MIQSHTQTQINFFKKIFEHEREESMLMLQFRSFKFYIIENATKKYLKTSLSYNLKFKKMKI